MDLIVTTPEKLGEIVKNAINEAIKSIPKEQPKQPNEVFLTRKEVAKLLKISLPTLNEHSKNGKIRSYLIGGRVLYRQSDILNSLHEVRAIKS